MFAPGDGAWDVHRRIVVILARAGARDTSREACQEWARKFIQRHVPDWVPGTPIPPEAAWRIGEMFVKRCAEAGVSFPALAPPTPPRRTRRDSARDDE